MKKFIFSFLLLTISCSTQSQVTVKKIDDREIVQLLIFSEQQDLNKLQLAFEKNLWLKLYKLPNTADNKCFPESHGICNYNYYIATSQLDDSPIINAYNVGVLGEIVEIKWVNTKDIEKAILNIKTNKFSKEALKYNKLLKNKVTNYKVVVTPNDLVVTNIKL